ncbi:M56 family metallopeptidase [Chryseobacterium sp. RG1]|uniref:M56 family metallopeptidase n=1 Tax=Chryseobacterium tagetis TaxID=2801334 RepID=A0ABS7ZZX2_9FLAO|nr:M56 family metallopeptidase [Chryseobacterium tagetis]MCA6067282.1 M56 family metallopeptidase [Chryseobacterium tagetis]
METIVLKIIICSGILLGCYHLFLAKEKTFVFNRFFLIFALVFSYGVPFITIKTQQKAPAEKIFFQNEEALQTVSYSQIPASQEAFDYTSLILPIYLLVAGILLCKLLFSIYKIKSLKGKKITYKSRTIKILEDNTPPFSFMNTIYISKDYFKEGSIENSIFLHEEIHVKQKHTADVLVTEILKILVWFNPFVYFYKKAIVTNHEFIADEEVIHVNKNIKNYQELILQEILKQQNLSLIHQFNFNNTKKRFIMMTRKNSKFAKAKKYLTIPAFAALAVFFVDKAYAKENSENLMQENKNTFSATPSNDPYSDFKLILEKYSDLLNKKEYAKFEREISSSDRKKLTELYNELTDQQKKETFIVFINPKKFEKNPPSAKDLQDFTNQNKYGLWIDGKKTNNQDLKNYTPTDFSHKFISKRYPNAISKKNPQPYQVDLMTNEYFKKYQQEDSKIIMGFKAEINSVKKDTTTPKTKISAKLEKIKNTNDDNTVTDLAIAPPPPPPAPAENLVQAEFPGGIHELRKQFANKFDTSAFGKDEKGMMKADIYISIDENGKATNIKADGKTPSFNSEATRAIKEVLANKTWTPATADGKPIQTVFKLPLTLNFQ